MCALFMNHILLTVCGQFKYVIKMFLFIYFIMYLFNDSLVFPVVGNHCVSFSTLIKQSSRRLGKIWDIRSMHESGTLT
jgi:hypothetical protein